MGSDCSKSSAQIPHTTRKNPRAAAVPCRRRSTTTTTTTTMRSASCIMDWLKPDCLNPEKPKMTRSKNPCKNTAGRSSAAAAGGGSGGGNSISLEEHLSTSSPLIGSGQTVKNRFPHPHSRKPSPKRIHPSSAPAGGGRRQRKSKSFTLETLVKLDRESRDDYEFGNDGGSNRRGNLVSRDGDDDGGGSSRSCGREAMKKAKSVRFTLPGDGDVFVFYSPKADVDKPYRSL